MSYIHYPLGYVSDGAVEVSLNTQANVKLMDEHNYQRYRRGDRHQYFGGRAVRSPIRLQPPHSGHWHVVIDLGGGSGRVQSSVRLVS